MDEEVPLNFNNQREESDDQIFEVENEPVHSKPILSLFSRASEICTKTLEQKLAINIVKHIVVLGAWGYLLHKSSIFWNRSLEGCTGDIIECLIEMQSTFDTIMYSVLYFTLIHFGIFIMGIHLKDPILKIVGILVPIATFVYLYRTCRGFTWADHSQGNFLLCEAMLFGLFVLYFIVLFNIYLFKRSKMLFLVWFTICMVVISTFTWTRIINSCGRQHLGLIEEDYYREDGVECQWLKSNICWHATLHGLFKPMYWFRSDCKKEPTDLSFYYTKSANSSSRIIGFPNPTDMSLDTIKHFATLQDKIINGSKPVDASAINDPKDDMEVFLDLSEEGNEKLIVNLKDVRNIHPEVKFQPHDLENVNILQIFVDTVSRPNFHRRFAKMSKFLSKYQYSKGETKAAYEFFRHHSNRGYTSPNLIGATYGNYNDAYDIAEKRIDSFAKKNGYVTGVLNDLCNAIEVEIESKLGL